MTEDIYANLTFDNLPTFWKAFVIIGIIGSVIFIILLSLIVYLMFETKIKSETDLAEYDSFINEFIDENSEKDTKELKIETESELKIDEYPTLPKIKDLNGNYLKNLMEIKIIS